MSAGEVEHVEYFLEKLVVEVRLELELEGAVGILLPQHSLQFVPVSCSTENKIH